MNRELTSPPYSHDLMNSLYTIKGMAEVHLERLKEKKGTGNGSDDFMPVPFFSETLNVMERVRRKSEDALSIVRRLREPKRGLAMAPKDICLSPFAGAQKVSLKRVFLETQRILTEKTGTGIDPPEPLPVPLFSSGVEFLDRVPKDFPPILSNRKEFREILHHLIKNSLDAMKENQSERRIILRASLIEFQGLPKAKITLSDTGKGIPPDTLSSLFTPFFTTKPEGKGNGLGLYLVKKLVEENQGVISLESFPNEGTTVTLVFPAALK